MSADGPDGSNATIRVNNGPEIPFDDFVRLAEGLGGGGPGLTVNAGAAALAWLNAFLATGTDAEKPALCKTLCLELFEAGVQFIGCNGTAVFRTFVPRAPRPDEQHYREPEWPILAEAPERTLIVMDADAFGIGFMRALLRVTGEDGHDGDLLHLATVPVDDKHEPTLGDAFTTERLTLRACGQRIDLQLFEDRYPNWRNARLGLDAIEYVDGLTIGPRMFALLGKLKGARAVDLEFYGDAKHIAFTARGDGTVETRGLLMPMRREKVEDDS